MATGIAQSWTLQHPGHAPTELKITLGPSHFSSFTPQHTAPPCSALHPSRILLTPQCASRAVSASRPFACAVHTAWYTSPQSIPPHSSSYSRSQHRHALLQEVLSDAPLAELGKSSGLAQCPVPPASQLSPVCLCFLPYLVTGLSPFLNQALQEDRPRTAFFSSISNIQHRTAP